MEDCVPWLAGSTMLEGFPFSLLTTELVFTATQLLLNLRWLWAYWGLEVLISEKLRIKG